jgi:putative RNA 2'-phosphotransferase
MSEKDLTRISRFLSFVLRHNPGAAGISLDAAGWVAVKELIEGARRAGFSLDRELLMLIVRNDKKRRYAVKDGGRAIRAEYGHSVPVDLGMEPTPPPEFLFHGTADRNIEAIRAGGLQSRGRQFVHLSGDAPTAIDVGRRHGRALALRVRAREMHENGHKFYHSRSGVWLTEYVPPNYIVLPRGRGARDKRGNQEADPADGQRSLR